MTPSISNNLLTIFGGCVFHILLPKILRLLIKKGLLKILVWRQNAPLNFLLKEGCSLLRVPEDIFFLSIPMFRGDAASTRCEALHKTEGTEKRATKNVQLVLQHCCKTSWIAILRVLPPMFTSLGERGSLFNIGVLTNRNGANLLTTWFVARQVLCGW